ncbi:restriction endonuclease subunit S [Nitrosopumilus maritimus]|uniref:Restriction modification system DNA specificity domain n=1 Tax=Nitrosopumilus maritimus (strain SCM1) TaxID=436308 RepID=A9A372_NITMS|nr:restriction endonuclease subunit S [Nitrosopumilus maritimus]ABX12501.1 restriction modification system DNA specificity domain [Nitrosopumilus maritimus SCM1]
MAKVKPGYKLVKSLFGKYEEIPEDWNYVILDKLTPKNEKSSIRMGPFGSSLKTHELLNSGKIKTLWIENIVNDKFTWKYQKFITEEKYEKLKGFTVKPNDVLITMMGTLGKTAIVPEDIGRAIISSHLLKISLDHEKLLPKFLYYFLKSNFVYRQIIKESRGLVMGGLNTGIIKNLLIKTPKISEQQKILSILSNVDNLIYSYEKIIDQTKHLKIGLLQQLLTKGIKHKKFKKVFDRFGNYFEIPDSWEYVKIKKLVDEKRILEIQDGNHGELHPKSLDFIQKGIPFVTADCLMNDNINYDLCKFLPEKFLKILRIGFAKQKDVLLSHKGSVGNVAVVGNKFDRIILSPQTTYYRLSSKIIPKFLYYIFQSFDFQKQLKSLAKQSTRDYIGITNQQNLLIPYISSIEEQEKIISVLSDVDSNISNLELKKKSLESLKKGLMQKLLTGKIRVKV